MTEKPPLGLTPEAIWMQGVNEDRVKDLRAGMLRYLAADKAIPTDWLEELRRRTSPPSYSFNSSVNDLRNFSQ